MQNYTDYTAKLCFVKVESYFWEKLKIMEFIDPVLQESILYICYINWDEN